MEVGETDADGKEVINCRTRSGRAPSRSRVQQQPGQTLLYLKLYLTLWRLLTINTLPGLKQRNMAALEEWREWERGFHVNAACIMQNACASPIGGIMKAR
jgi:hypothetical protein